MACTNDECKNTRKILRNGEVAPPKEDPVPLPELPCEKSDAYFVLRDGAAGIFLAANTFPKSRETRAPLVEELYRFRDRLPENCAIWQMRRRLTRTATSRWFVSAVKPSSNTLLRRKTVRRPAGPRSSLTVNG